MNLLLMNVDETYTVMVRVPHPYTVTVHEPADPQPLQPDYAINPNTGTPFLSCYPDDCCCPYAAVKYAWLCCNCCYQIVKIWISQVEASGHQLPSLLLLCPRQPFQPLAAEHAHPETPHCLRHLLLFSAPSL